MSHSSNIPIPRSAGGCPLNPTVQQLAAACQAVNDVYDEWADSVEVKVPPGGFKDDEALWPEATFDDGPDPEVTRQRVIDATSP